LDKRRILIVDDDPDHLRLLEDSIGLYCAECEVVSASNGYAALEQIEGQPVDLILTDYQMPGMNGLELASTVHRTSPGTPIVLVTAHRGGGWLQERAQSLDLVGYLQKPFTMAHIRELLDRSLDAGCCS
jgi:two-component system response regulator GlrR